MQLYFIEISHTIGIYSSEIQGTIKTQAMWVFGFKRCVILVQLPYKLSEMFGLKCTVTFDLGG